MLNRREPKEIRRHRPTTTDVILLLDMSGSMQIRRDETIREVNRYLDKLKSDGGRYRVTVKTFNEYVDTLVSHKPIRDVGELEHSEYRPNGWTRLLDAVGNTLSNGYNFTYRDGTRDRTLFVVVTDGQENDSRRYGLQEVRDMIDRKRSEDFQFVFLGDGPGAWQVGSKMGFNFSVSTDWSNPQNTENIYNALASTSSSYSKSGIITTSMLSTPSTSATVTTPSEDE